MTNSEGDDGLGGHHIDNYTKLYNWFQWNEQPTNGNQFGLVYLKQISQCFWNSKELENLTKEEFGANMGNNEQLCVYKELWGFDVQGNNYYVMKMFVELQSISQ
jgi:hypothetical protein